MKRKLIYHGERVGHLGNIYQLFKDKRGKEHTWKSLKHVWIGSVYQTNDDETMKTSPDPIDSKGWELTEAEQQEAEAQKLVVKTARLENRKAMQLKKPHVDIARAIELLGPFYRSLSHFDQSRFMKYITNEMSKRRKKK